MPQVSQMQIAEMLGVSQRTVSKALRNEPKVSASTRHAVLAKAAELGYRPNDMARAVIEGRSHTIGVLLPVFNTPFFSQILHVIQRELDGAGYRLVPAQWNSTPVRENLCNLEPMLRLAVDGIIANPRMSERWQAGCFPELIAQGHKIVFLNEKAFLPGCHSVFSDDYAGMRGAVEHLVDHGHRHIAFVGYGVEARLACTMRMRWRGYRHGVEAIGTQPMMLRLAHPTREGETVDHFLRQHAEVTAFCCFNDGLAVALMRDLLAMGADIPEDFSVVGYGDDIAYADLMRTPLTTVGQHPELMAETAVAQLLAMLQGRPVGRASVIPTKLITRASVKTLGSANGYATE